MRNKTGNSIVAITLRRDDCRIRLRFYLSPIPYCAGVRYVNDKRGEYLEFSPGQAYVEQAGEYHAFPYHIRLYAKSFVALRIG